MSNSQESSNDRSNKIKQTQTENHDLTIRNSNNVHVVQTELRGLLLVQASLQAALQAAIFSLGDEEKTKKLQEVSHTLETAQIQAQSLVIEDSEGITLSHTELQINAVVQAAIDLLAKLALGSE